MYKKGNIYKMCAACELGSVIFPRVLIESTVPFGRSLEIHLKTGGPKGGLWALPAPTAKTAGYATPGEWGPNTIS